MGNILLLFVCLMLGIGLRWLNRMPEAAPAALNAFVINISLPALVLVQLHGMVLRSGLVFAVAMPWMLFAVGCAFFWAAGRMLRLDTPTVGALMLAGGLANTSFVGLPMIEAFYGRAEMSVGILIDQLGTYLVLSTVGIFIAAAFAGGSVSRAEVVRRIVTFPPLLALAVAVLLSGVAYPHWLNELLGRLSVTLVPLALVSVGLQLRLTALEGNVRALLTGLGFKLVLGPAVIALVYLLLLHVSGETVRVTLFEAAMGPMIGGAIVASQSRLNPPLVSLMVGTGITLSFVTLPLWYLALAAF
ncbi:MAG: AEC family transporter [Rhodospirillales bacterium]|nr:AEC family transporter [Rhodospirillales bacterium]MDE2198873.1 AEC family transporter [Rhodospirillales bacterium]MDE2574294.1 AEC family transporter [Rhodospirillales bacterium]